MFLFTEAVTSSSRNINSNSKTSTHGEKKSKIIGDDDEDNNSDDVIVQCEEMDSSTAVGPEGDGRSSTGDDCGKGVREGEKSNEIVVEGTEGGEGAVASEEDKKVSRVCKEFDREVGCFKRDFLSGGMETRGGVSIVTPFPRLGP